MTERIKGITIAATDIYGQVLTVESTLIEWLHYIATTLKDNRLIDDNVKKDDNESIT